MVPGESAWRSASAWAGVSEGVVTVSTSAEAPGPAGVLFSIEKRLPVGSLFSLFRLSLLVYRFMSRRR